MYRNALLSIIKKISKDFIKRFRFISIASANNVINKEMKMHNVV